jgi:hypothetical protein
VGWISAPTVQLSHFLERHRHSANLDEATPETGRSTRSEEEGVRVFDGRWSKPVWNNALFIMKAHAIVSGLLQPGMPD